MIVKHEFGSIPLDSYSLESISLYFRKLIMPVAYQEQAEYIVVNQDDLIENTEKKKITLIVNGNQGNIDDFHQIFQNEWLNNHDIFPEESDRIYVLAGYKEVDSEWTQESLAKYIVDKKDLIEKDLNGQVDHIYGHSMGGLLATLLYKDMQENSDDNAITYFTLDRTFSHLLPMAGRYLHSEFVAKILLYLIKADLNNPIDALQEGNLPWLDTEHMTVIESIGDNTIHNEEQIGPLLRHLAEQDFAAAKNIKYFQLSTTEHIKPGGAHDVGLGLETTTLKRIDYGGNDLLIDDSMDEYSSVALNDC